MKVDILSKETKELILTVGFPYSGKSTWAKNQGCPIVNPDSIRIALHGQRFFSDAEPLVWAIAKMMVKSLFLAGHKKVILDSTNISIKRRKEWKSENYHLSIALFVWDSKTCINRARENNDEDIIPIIEKMSIQNECPYQSGEGIPVDVVIGRPDFSAVGRY